MAWRRATLSSTDCSVSADRAPRVALVVAALVIILAAAVLIAAMLGPYRATPGEVLSAILRIGGPAHGPIDTILFLKFRRAGWL